MTVAQLQTETDEVIAEAQAEVDAAEEQAQASSVIDGVSRRAIGVVVALVWGVAVLGFGIWVLGESPDFVCTQPGVPTGADYVGECTNGWSSAIEHVKDLISTFVLPVLTLVLGYYFGVRTAEQAEGE